MNKKKLKKWIKKQIRKEIAKYQIENSDDIIEPDPHAWQLARP